MTAKILWLLSASLMLARNSVSFEQQPRLGIEDLFKAFSRVVARSGQVFEDKQFDLFDERTLVRTDVEETVQQGADKRSRAAATLAEALPVETVGDAVQAVGHGQWSAILAVSPAVAISDGSDELIDSRGVVDRCMGPGDEQAAVVIRSADDTLVPGDGSVRLSDRICWPGVR